MDPAFPIPALEIGTATLSTCLPAGVGLIAGLILWLLGGRVLRPVTVVLGGAAGALLGSLVAPALLTSPLQGIPPPLAGGAVGGVLGLVAAAAFFRFAMAGAGLTVFGAVGVLAAGAWLGIGTHLTTPDATVAAAPGLDRTALVGIGHRYLESRWRQDGAGTTAEDPASAAVLDAARIAVDASARNAQARWLGIPADGRLTLAGAGLAAGFFGLLLGALMPRRAAAVITGLLGAGVALASTAWLAHLLDLPGRDLLAMGPMAWLGLWGALAAVGITLQLTSVKPAATTA